MSSPDPTSSVAYDRAAIFEDISPIDPTFMQEAVRTLMRALPLADPSEPANFSYRRMNGALVALSALHPRDEIEVMLGVQALSAYHAAAACWRIGMNLRRPHGDSTRHITTAATAARTFDTLLKALERRQAKPLAIPTGRPTPRNWQDVDPATIMHAWEHRCGGVDHTSQPPPPAEWTPEALRITAAVSEQDRTEAENAGLDIANTEGILPGGGMVMPEDPTPQQSAYIARRLGLQYKREHAENLRLGIRRMPQIRPVRPGDLIP
jgi:hypothetical protein